MTPIDPLVRLLSWVLTCLIHHWDGLTYVVAKIVHAFYEVFTFAMIELSQETMNQLSHS